MCGRFTLTVSGKVLGDLFGTTGQPELAPRYNIAPTQLHPVVSVDEDGDRVWSQARWGLIPSWAKDMKVGARMINARAETVASKPAFRSALRLRRCLVPADGFYEWRKVGSGKQPYHIHFEDRRPFAFAGLWELWREPEGSWLRSFTIVTTEANEVVSPVHHRMPVILAPELYGEWLEHRPLATERTGALLVPHPHSQMEAFPVDARVGSPAHDDPACMAPVAQSTLW